MKKSYFILDVDKSHIVYIGELVCKNIALDSLGEEIGARVKFLAEECLHTFKEDINNNIEMTLLECNLSQAFDKPTDITNIIPV